VVIARSLITNPSFVVADEPVAALDMSVRAKVLELMLELKNELDLTYLFITHDLATARFLCDRIGILYLGRFAEWGDTDRLFDDPQHPYTRSLLDAIPLPDPTRRDRVKELPRGEIPDALAPPLGCRFHPRCPAAFEPCGWEGRDLIDALEQRWTEVDEDTFERELGMVGQLGDAEVETDEVRFPSAAPGRARPLAARTRRAAADQRVRRRGRRRDVVGRRHGAVRPRARTRRADGRGPPGRLPPARGHGPTRRGSRRGSGGGGRRRQPTRRPLASVAAVPGSSPARPTRLPAARTSMATIDANPPSGTRDFLPAEVARRERAFATIRTAFQAHGFEPLDTPAFERLEVLTGKYGEEGDQLIFKILRRGEHEATGEADLALRYDLTVPLARVAARYGSQLAMPFKRYHIAPVWRADRPGRGRFREFFQCDVDTVGSDSLVADATTLVAVADVLDRLGLAGFRIQLNSRQALAGLIEAYGVPGSSRPRR
jgi:oligopeptide/dipeptide ABC transporter ATP-binding protein